MKKSCYIAVMATMMAFTTQAEAREFNPFTGQYEPSESNSFSDNVKEGEAFQPYIGVGLSSITMDFSAANGGGISGFGKASAMGYTIKGGVDIQRYFGLEVRMFGSGNASSTGSGFGQIINASAKINNGFGYFAKLQMPFENGFRAYALLGQSNANLTVTVQVLGQSFTTTSGSGSTGSIGGGLSYDKNDNIFEIEYMKYATDTSALSIFAGYKF